MRAIKKRLKRSPKRTKPTVERHLPLWLLLLAYLSLCGGQMGGLHAEERPHHPALASPPPVAEQVSRWRVELLSKRRTQLSSEMEQRITRMTVREGRRFAKGDLLVAFDCALEQAQLQKARAFLEAAEAKAQVHDRLSRLQATSKLEEKVAQAEVAQARAEMAIIQVKIDHCQILAPFAGRVVTLNAQEHHYVKAGDPLLEILDEENLEVVFLLPSKQLLQLAVGDRFEVSIEETQRSYPAQVNAFGAMIDSVSQSIKVFGSIDGRFAELLPGMSGTARLLTREAPHPRSPP